MANTDWAANAFLQWFSRHGTQHPDVSLCEFPGMGRGAVALQNLPEGTVLFSVPRSLLLNASNARLRSLLTTEEWSSLTGWLPLILSMMWESLQADSLWKAYFDILPKYFDSLMFWTEDEKSMLQGSAILGKIGKEQALQDYREIMMPLVERRPDIFGPSTLYSIDLYDRMGSAVLSRSFHVEAHEEEQHNEAGEDSAQAFIVQSMTSGDYDGPTNEGASIEAHEADEDDADSLDDEEDDAANNVAMVPWADMLNARPDLNNARLFYEKDCLSMSATMLIHKGEQIWNTYGDLPNSDLLRKYGHVDLSNPADVVEVTADLIAEVVNPSLDSRQHRINFLLDADLDDAYDFTLSDNEEMLQQMLCAIAVFAADDATLELYQNKGKVSKKDVKGNTKLLEYAKLVFEKRLRQYPFDYEQDEIITQTTGSLSHRQVCAVIVRHGEMKILRSLVEDISRRIEACAPSTSKILKDKSRRANEERPAAKRIKR